MFTKHNLHTWNGTTAIGLVLGLLGGACASTGTGDTDGAGGKADHQDEILTRIMERGDGTVRVQMKRFEDDGLHESAERLMLGNKEFGPISLDEWIVEVDDDLYREQIATLIAADGAETDVTDTNHIYTRVKYTDEENGTADGTVMGKRDHEPRGNYLALDFVFESLCDTYPTRIVDGVQKFMTTMKEFTDSELWESAETQLMGNFDLFPEDLTILKVRKRMFREQSNVTIPDNTDVTNRDNIYIQVDLDDDDGGVDREFVWGRRDKDNRDKFVPIAGVWKRGECVASGQ